MIKIVQTPLTDPEGFIDRADWKANGADRPATGAASLKSLKVNRPAIRLKSVDKSIVELAKQDPELNRLFERVTAVVGISQATAAELIVTTAGRPRNEFKAITDPKKFARVWLNPYFT